MSRVLVKDQVFSYLKGESMNIQWVVEKVVLQPTTFCNINCTYCYLAERNKAKRMGLDVLQSLSEWVPTNDRPVEVIWHGGEPMSVGINHFRKHLEVLEDCRRKNFLSHVIQTNGTLITSEWCELFREFDVKVSLSIDGPSSANSRRVDWQGREVFGYILSGVDMLRASNIPFSSICVVSKETLSIPDKLYEFFCELGCTDVGFNIEEKVGINTYSASDDKDLVTDFWRRLFQAWIANPCIGIREFVGILSWMEDVCDEKPVSRLYDLFPTIGWNGDVVLLAPEFLNTPTSKYGTFAIGNVLRESLGTILARASETPYVEDYVAGVNSCGAECQYFGFCKGGIGSNKYFELGWTGGTETVYCRNREQRLVDGVLNVL